MPASTQTRIVSPVVLAESRRARLLRRAFALLAFLAFVAGILVASGFPELVVAAAPFVAAAGVATGVAWIVLGLRPWRVVRPAGHAAAVAGRTVGHGAAWTGHTATRGAVAVPPLARSGWISVAVFMSRPRERWRPPRPVEAAISRTRAACASLLERAAPARVRADTEWNRAAAAGLALAHRGPTAVAHAYSSRDRQARARRVLRAGRRRARTR